MYSQMRPTSQWNEDFSEIVPLNGVEYHAARMPHVGCRAYLRGPLPPVPRTSCERESVCVSVCECCVCVCVCVCCVCVCVWVCVCVCVCVCTTLSVEYHVCVCVCVCKRERERESTNTHTHTHTHTTHTLPPICGGTLTQRRRKSTLRQLHKIPPNSLIGTTTPCVCARVCMCVCVYRDTQTRDTHTHTTQRERERERDHLDELQGVEDQRRPRTQGPARRARQSRRLARLRC
jgi:hypothetical protein